MLLCRLHAQLRLQRLALLLGLRWLRRLRRRLGMQKAGGAGSELLQQVSSRDEASLGHRQLGEV